MFDDSVELCQQLRGNAAEAVRLAAVIAEKKTRAVVLGLARDLTALAVEVEASMTAIIAPANVVEQIDGNDKPKSR